jgi:HEAT repeat protein
MSPEPEAVEYVAAELKIDWFGRRGFVDGDPGSADGRGDRQDRLMHSIGVLSPPVYWKVVADYLDHDDEKLRNEAAVALEQLAAPESAKAIASALSKEKSAAVRKDLARALGSAGAGDDKARKALLKCAGSDKDELVRRNAVVALGWLVPGSDVHKALGDSLSAAEPGRRSAAALAMALSRNPAWIPILEQAGTAEADPEAKAHAKAALEVLRGAPLGSLRSSVASVCGDTIARERIFGAEAR